MKVLCAWHVQALNEHQQHIIQLLQQQRLREILNTSQADMLQRQQAALQLQAAQQAQLQQQHLQQLRNQQVLSQFSHSTLPLVALSVCDFQW